MNILLVSIDEKVISEVHRILEANHMKVILCDSISHARERSYEQACNLIMIHRSTMAEDNAIEDIRKLSEDAPVLLITDTYHQQEIVDAYDIGMIDYITEPINQQDFISRIYLSFKRKHHIDMKDTLKHSLAHLRMSYDALFEVSPDCIVHIDTKHHIVDANNQFLKLFGYKHEEVIGKLVYNIVDPDGKVKEYGAPRILEGKAILFEDTVRYSKNGDPISVMHKGIPLQIDGEIIGGYVIYTDITERKQAEKTLIDQLKFLNKLLDTIPNPVYYKDIDGVYLGCNRAFEELFEVTKEELIGKTTRYIAPSEIATNNEERDNELLNAPGTQKYEYKIQRNGKHRDVIFNKATYNDADGKVAGMVGTILDITERKELEERNRVLAYRDPLTGLLNIRSLHEQFLETLKSLEETGEQGAVLFIDLDRFKVVNDSLGHQFGDLLLQEIAERISKCIDFPVFRPGGDEFIVLVSDASNVVNVVNTIIDEINRPHTIIDRELSITASIGISLYPQDGRDINTLFSNADTAMYRAKERGKNQYCFYTEEMNARMLEHLTIENELRRALEKDELELFYQPQIDSLTEEFIGMEALIRWNNPFRGLISPDVFIPIAEETGLILPIGDWVVKQACYQNKEWQKQGLKKIPVAVNVSPLQFAHPDFIKNIENILQETGLEPEYLDIEITESTAMSDIDEVIKKTTQLREMGIQVSIDDFGTGYSSLSNFRKLPINKLKIDRSFIDRILVDTKDAAIVDTIIAMAQRLGLGIIAEGVETREHMKHLQDCKCNLAQGYLYSKPLKANEIAKLLV